MKGEIRLPKIRLGLAIATEPLSRQCVENMPIGWPVRLISGVDCAEL